MRCKRLHVERAPGLPRGLPELELPDGLVVVSGPNGSGKSTLARAIRALLWDGEANTGLRVQSSWEVGDQACDAGVFAGRVHWDPTPATSPPPTAAGLARLGIRSLLSDSHQGDAALAAQLLRELTGGLDLQQASASFSRQARLSANTILSRDLKTARAEKTRATKATDDLSEREGRLRDLEADLEAARAAARRLRACDALKERLQAAEQLANARAVVGAFEPGLDGVEEDDQERLDEIENSLARERARLRGSRSDEAAHAAERDAHAFPGKVPDRVDIESEPRRLDELADVERSLNELTRELEGARARLASARAEILFPPDDTPDDAPTPGALDALAEALEAVRNSKAAAEAATTIRQAWAADAGEVREGDEERLRRAVDDLRTWLQQPDAVEPSDAPTRPSVVAAALAIVAALLALVVAVNITTPAWLAGMAWGAVVASLSVFVLVLLRRRATDPAATDVSRVDHRRQLESASRDEDLTPERWEHDAVSTCLEKLEGQLIDARAALKARDRSTAAAHDQEAAEQRVADATSSLRTQTEALGLATDFVELTAVRQAQALARLGEARDACARIEAEHRRAADQVSEGLTAFSHWIEPFGVKQPIRDVAAARALMGSLTQRLSAYENAVEKLRSASEQRHAVEAGIAGKESELAAFWARVGLEAGDRAGLQRRVESLPRWRSAREELLEQQGALHARTEAFETARHEAPDDDHLAAVDPDAVTNTEVDAWREAAAAEADGLEALRSERSKIQAALEQAEQGASLADAIANVRAAERAVAEERDRALEDVMARALLEEARTRHESSHAPPVLNRARDLLSRFTHDGWRLDVDSDGAFRARDVACDEPRSLAELSDGTRTQLLLAARMAALEGLEASGEPLPLCLDEALANSDPDRFRAVAEALLELVDDGRQVLYLTADPGEAEQWRAVCLQLDRPEPARVDLCDSVEVPAWGDTVPAVPAAPQPVPDPDDTTPAEYAVLVGADRPDGFEPGSSWHLYVVAYDDLSALRSCLERRLARVGPWREMRRRGRSVLGVPEPVAARFDDRIALADALRSAWCVGRGRPVEWADVEASGAVSDTYEDQVRDVLEQHAYTPRRFIDEVGNLKGFRHAKLEELRAHLEQVGCLAVDEPLSHDELVAQAMQTAPDAVERLGPDDASAYLDWLVALLDGDA